MIMWGEKESIKTKGDEIYKVRMLQVGRYHTFIWKWNLDSERNISKIQAGNRNFKQYQGMYEIRQN
jgi:hypothetical protein